ncbi:MAG: hypothetical protein JWO53_916 [Chlamydiia bacterium]|nr:hypothetical protein [Chlamydiia bacterium]
MNTLLLVHFDSVAFYLDKKSLAKTSSINKRWWRWRQDIGAHPSSSQRPQFASSPQDKILACYKYFLENFAVNQSRRFSITSPDFVFQVDLFCVDKIRYLEIENKCLHWQSPTPALHTIEKPATDYIKYYLKYSIRDCQEILAVWGYFFRITFTPQRSLLPLSYDMNPLAQDFVKDLQKHTIAHIENLQSTMEKTLIQSFQKMPYENREKYLINHQESIPTTRDLGTYIQKQIDRLTHYQPNKARRVRFTCIKTAVKVVALSLAVKFLIFTIPEYI